jgi:putative transposase
MYLKDMVSRADTKGQNTEKDRDFMILMPSTVTSPPNPLSNFEIDLKEIYDTGTLTEECISHASKVNIPPYQWTAIDVKTRLRFFSYSYEKSFTNGLIFMLSLIYFLRALGIDHEITLQTDNGEEFGGKSVDKLDYLNRMIFKPLNAKLIHIPKGRKV